MRFADCEDAVRKCVRSTKTYLPNPAVCEAYAEAFAVWGRCYSISGREIYI